MAAYLRNLPFFAVLLLVAAGAMMVPAVYAGVNEDFTSARDFFYPSLLVGTVAMIVGFTAQSGLRVDRERVYLISLFFAYLWLPFVLAIPMVESIGNTRFINVYFDMVSALTTTGAPIFDPDRLTPAAHLWRGIVGWLGGLLMWITAAAVLAPLNLGGYEVTSEATTMGRLIPGQGQIRTVSAVERLRKNAGRLIPIYGALTATLMGGLVMAGDPPLVAAIHAMSVMATSGITPSGGLGAAPTGLTGEVLIFFFMIFALSRHTFADGFGKNALMRLGKDRELRLAIVAIVVFPTLLFVRHWLGALDVDDSDNITAALAALWGSIFTVLSFLTTTGFVSDTWITARGWSGLDAPGLILMGLAIMGGGVATTAGGLKLLRVYALYKHGAREIGKLIHPHSVAGAGRLGRRIRREGAYIAWIFFMLFILSLAMVMVALALSGLSFETAMILAVATLSTTGPLATVAGEAPIIYATLGDAAKIILSGAMIVGRMETLVLIALLGSGFWRA